MPVTIIAAMDKNRVIGHQNTLPWHLPDDLKHFKALSMGTVLLMGRKTYESLPNPLPGREHWVLSRTQHGSVAGGKFIASIEDALTLTKNAQISVVGGAEVYSQALPYADCMALTMVNAEVQGDVFFPKWDHAVWDETSTALHLKDDKHAFDFRFVTLKRSA